MMIDCHTHIDFSSAEDNIYAPEHVGEMLINCGIEQAVAFPSFSLKPDNLSFARNLKQFQDKFYGFAWLNPHASDAAEDLIHLVRHEGIKGLKLHPLLHAFFPNRPVLDPLMKAAREVDVPVLFHSGHEPFSLPWQIAEVAAKYPEVTVIMDHMGLQLGYVDDAIELAKRYENIILGTTAMPFHLKIKKAVQEVGKERVVFGSDAPVIHPKVEMERVKLAGLTADEEEHIFAKNMTRILKL